MVKDVHPNVHGCSSGALKGMNLKMHLFQDFYSANYNMILPFIFLNCFLHSPRHSSNKNFT